MIVGKAKRLLAAAIAVLMIGQMILASTDWSKEVVESNMKRYPTAESLKGGATRNPCICTANIWSILTNATPRTITALAG